MDSNGDTKLAFPCPLHELYPSTKTLTKAQVKHARRELKVKVKTGKFTEEENRILHKNAKHVFKKKAKEMDETELFNYKIAMLGFFRHSSKHKNSSINKELNEDRKKFLLRLGKNLPNRSLLSIFNRARNCLSPLANVKDMSREQLKKVYKLHKRGKKYIRIAEEVNCNPRAVQTLIRQKYNEEGAKYKHGKWSLKETEILLNGIMDALKIEDIKECLGKPIPWSILAKKVGTRSSIQCQKRFKDQLYYKIGACEDIEMALHYTSKQRKSDLAKIIYFMFKEKYKSEEAIDWNLLSSKMPNLSLRSLMNLWEDVKTDVPSHIETNYTQLVAHLMAQVLPTCINILDDSALVGLNQFYTSD